MTKISKNHYQSFLENASISKFASLKHSQEITNDLQPHVPTLEEVVAHLKILKAFQLLKINVVGKPGDIGKDGSFIKFTDKQIKCWQAYISNASRRFIIYVSALKYKFKNSSPHQLEAAQLDTYKTDVKLKLISEFISRVLPPLDVLMIWHSFTLNPKAFYENGLRNNFLEFTLCPFPLYQALMIIDESTFIYKPSSIQVEEFQFFTREFGIEIDYDYGFDLNKILSIICPICGNILATKSRLTSSNNQGFADPGFSTLADGECNCCKYNPVVSHEDLRFRQLHADLVNDANVSKYMPNIIRRSSRFLNKNPSLTSERLDTIIRKHSGLIISTIMSSNDWLQFMTHIKMYLKTNLEGKEVYNLLKDYEQMNLLHLTIPKANKGPIIQISEDLVSMTIRQERFIMKMNSFDLLHSKIYVQQSVNESINRYLKFFQLMTENYMVNMLVPTLDIDLIWHTHQLSPIYYIQYSRTTTDGKYVVGHDDKVDEDSLSASFQQTGNLYYLKYGEHYYYCPCSFCNETPQNSRPVVQSLFANGNSDKSQLVLNNSTSTLLRVSNKDTNTNASHISAHNAVRKKSIGNGKRRRSYKTIEKPFPWNDWNAETRALSKYGGYFVLQPITEENPNCLNVSEKCANDDGERQNSIANCLSSGTSLQKLDINMGTTSPRRLDGSASIFSTKSIESAFPPEKEGNKSNFGLLGGCVFD